jgi:hypothetical protein
MERRRFLQLFGLGVGGVALHQAIPLGRVWSFPKEIVIARAQNPFEELNAVIDKWNAAPQLFFHDSHGRLWMWPAGITKPIQMSYVPNPAAFPVYKPHKFTTFDGIECDGVLVTDPIPASPSGS